MNLPLDFNCREIKAGNTVAYPVRRGSKMWLQRVVVTQIEPDGEGFKIKGYTNAGRRVTIKNLQMTIILDQQD